MDFGELLSVAQKNSSTKQNVSYYPSKFTPPKKEVKQSKTLSENIKKFLARKEEEEKRKSLDEKRRKENLLSLRDHKAQSRINKHLKICKAANKSVLADAINHEDTAVTIAGPSQPDEDDYGYVSQEASAFYDKLMNKYQSLPPEKPLFAESGKKIVKDIASTKDRVKQALKQQELDASLPHRRKRKSEATGRSDRESHDNSNDRDSYSNNNNNSNNSNSSRNGEDEKPKAKKRPLPPPIDFMSLLKLAEQKQHEPVVIEPKVKPKEDTVRPMTKKQKKEYMKEKEWKDKREREKNGDVKTSGSSDKSSVKSSSASTSSSSSSSSMTPSKNLKLNGNKVSSADKNDRTDRDRTSDKSDRVGDKNDRMSSKSTPVSKKTSDKNNEKSVSSKINPKDEILEERRKLEAEKREIENMRRVLEEERRKLAMIKNKKPDDRLSTSGANKNNGSNNSNNNNNLKSSSGSISSSSNGKFNGRDDRDGKLKMDKRIDGKTNKFPPDVRPRQFPPADVKPRQFPPGDVKPRQFPPADVKPRQFPPADVKARNFPPSVKKNGSKLPINKRRIYDDDDDEEEYDSELDDFIDDDPQEGSEDYSKYISEIFGYDKSKYSNFDDDDANMESNYAQQLKEEFVSTKIGIMEDLEDIRQEALEKKRKASMLKKIKKK
ncbi:protein SPT2 homolog [Microplitis demolitor]|uniref:protein SPT2 homolog n=1 Tax=Microplitis demolitor TaxID=69319 RepID=UPI0004CD4F23|nr:protein SPT2 homolog [Microplitis demolitor]